MRTFLRAQPAAVGCFFLVIIGGAMFITDPILRIISLFFGILGGALMRIFREPVKDMRFYLFIFAALTLTNPLFVHRGNTVLFYINGRAFTFEALIYGADMSVSLISMLIWFRLFSEIMTSDKINSLFGRHFSPIATVFTLVLRYVPTFKKRYYEIQSAQKTAGFLCGETFFQRVRAQLNVFFSLAVSSLELSVRTADSMNARGFSLSGHTDLMKNRWRAQDFFVLAFSVITLAVLITVSVFGGSRCGFYPVFRCRPEPFTIIFYAALCSLPAIFEVKERLKWRCCNAEI